MVDEGSGRRGGGGGGGGGFFSLINTKFIVYFGLAAYWSVMLLGTFIGI